MSWSLCRYSQVFVCCLVSFGISQFPCLFATASLCLDFFIKRLLIITMIGIDWLSSLVSNKKVCSIPIKETHNYVAMPAFSSGGLNATNHPKDFCSLLKPRSNGIPSEVTGKPSAENPQELPHSEGLLLRRFSRRSSCCCTALHHYNPFWLKPEGKK